MTEYNVAIPAIPNEYKVQPVKTGAAQGRIHPEVGVYKAIREYFEQFEAELETGQEIAIRLASFGNEVDFRLEKIGFTLPSIITFIGVTDVGERIQLVQHVSQLSYMLRAVEKLNDQPTRIAFFH